MSFASFKHWPTVSIRLGTGVALLVVSCLLLSDHASEVRAMRDTGLPAAVALPILEQRMNILKEQNQTAELQAALSTGSQQEMLNVYVLPSSTGSVRVLASLDALFTQLKHTKDLIDISPVTVGAQTEGTGGTMSMPFSLTAHVTKQGWKNMLLFINLSGLMTVGDTIDDADFNNLLSLTEQENPASIAALEQFFAVDLLTYAQDPRSYDERLLQSFTSDSALAAVHSFINSPRLQSVRDLLKSMSGQLRSSHLWPLQFMQIEKSSQHLRDDGTLDVTLTVGAYGRTAR